jgi:ADP-ribose pyrophosphatase YjhB (NUDIX family)
MTNTLEIPIASRLNGSANETVVEDNNRIQPQNRPIEPKQRPRLGCAGLILRDGRVLLGKRNKEPNRGLWVLPGGGVEFGESFAQTLERELLEEAGIAVEVRDVFKTYELINLPNEHRVIVYLIAEHRSGEPVASSDLSDVRFLDMNEMRDLSDAKQISPFVEKVLREAALL